MSGPPGKPSRVRAWRYIQLAVLRPMFTVAALVTLYYVLPVDRRLDLWGLLLLIAGLCLVVALVAWQVRLILRSQHPALQGIEALAVILPLFLLLFAFAYYILEHNLAGSFTTHLTRTDALYFVVTVFATVGFGDIAAATQLARILVTIQMVADLLVLGLVLRVILSAVERGRRARR